MPAKLERQRWGRGETPPILMLHEGLGSVSLWRDVPDRLAAATEREVIAYSRLGYGQSDPFPAPYDLDFMHREADAAAALMDDLGLQEAHVFGHSDGASIALLLAARHPLRVTSLVLEAPHVFVEPICTAAIRALEPQSDALSARLARYHRDATAVFRQWFSIWTDPRFPDWTIETDIADIRCPVLAIQGAADEYGSFEQLDRIASRLPQMHQVRLAACGHSPHRDCAEPVLAACRAFDQVVAEAHHAECGVRGLYHLVAERLCPQPYRQASLSVPSALICWAGCDHDQRTAHLGHAAQCRLPRPDEWAKSAHARMDLQRLSVQLI